MLGHAGSAPGSRYIRSLQRAYGSVHALILDLFDVVISGVPAAEFYVYVCPVDHLQGVADVAIYGRVATMELFRPPVRQ